MIVGRRSGPESVFIDTATTDAALTDGSRSSSSAPGAFIGHGRSRADNSGNINL